MIDEQNLKNAISCAEDIKILLGNFNGENPKENEAIETLQSLATQYLKASEDMPLSKDVRLEITEWLEPKEYCEGYNQALLSCTLSHLKAKEKWEAELESRILHLQKGFCSDPDMDEEGTPVGRCGKCFECCYDQIVVSIATAMSRTHILSQEEKEKSK